MVLCVLFYALPPGDGVSRARSAARAFCRDRMIPLVSGFSPPNTRRVTRIVFSNVATASRRSPSVAAGSSQSAIVYVFLQVEPEHRVRSAVQSRVGVAARLQIRTNDLAIINLRNMSQVPRELPVRPVAEGMIQGDLGLIVHLEREAAERPALFAIFRAEGVPASLGQGSHDLGRTA